MARKTRTFPPEDNPEVSRYADGTVAVDYGEEEDGEEQAEESEENGE